MTTKTINGSEYSLLPMDTFSQLTLSRKGAPLFLGLAKTANLDTLNEVYGRALSVFADLSEEDFNLLISTVMPFVRRKQSDNWTPIYVKSSQSFTFDDISSGVIIELLIMAMMEYLPPFFTALDHIILGTSNEKLD